MDAESARRRLDAEAARLRSVRDSFAGNHLHDETEAETFSELSSYDQHPADMGTETFEREKDLSIVTQVEAELEDIERSLRRVESGTYGICEACGRQIDEARLEAVPTARFCLEDQAQAERRASAG